MIRLLFLFTFIASGSFLYFFPTSYTFGIQTGLTSPIVLECFSLGFDIWFHPARYLEKITYLEFEYAPEGKERQFKKLIAILDYLGGRTPKALESMAEDAVNMERAGQLNQMMDDYEKVTELHKSIHYPATIAFAFTSAVIAGYLITNAVKMLV